MVEMTAYPSVWNWKWVIWRVVLIQMATKMVVLIQMDELTLMVDMKEMSSVR
jgi:hypothetical protein